jgi:hypothetical protein
MKKSGALAGFEPSTPGFEGRPKRQLESQTMRI